jgi:hypothetical protein
MLLLVMSHGQVSPNGRLLALRLGVTDEEERAESLGGYND